jgi:hypothetical protein
MVFLHDDCDPSTLTRALSAGYNIIYVPIERVGCLQGDDIKIPVHVLHTKKIPWPWGLCVRNRLGRGQTRM